MTPAVTIDYRFIGSDGRSDGRLMAELMAFDRNGKLLAADQLNLGSAAARCRFVRLVASRCPEADAAELEQTLLSLASQRRREADLDAAQRFDRQGRRCAAVAGESVLAELALNRDTGKVDFLLYDCRSGRVDRADKVQVDGQTYIPVGLQLASLCTPGFGQRSGAVLLPTEAADYGEDATLLADIQAFVHRYVELPEPFEQIASWCVVFTYVFDRFDELAYLLFRTADIGRGKSRALETVGSICYRPIFIGGSSTPAALRRMIDSFGGTVVGDEQDCRGDSELTAAWVKILNQGFQRGRPVVVCDTSGDDPQPQAFNVYGPKLLAARRRFADDALESRCLLVPMRQRTRQDIPINLPRAQFDAEALELRNKLTLWRFRNRHQVRLDPNLTIAGVEDRLNQIAVPLLSVISNRSVREQLVGVLKASQADLVQQRAETLAGEVLEAVLAIARPGGIVRPGEVALEVNRRRAEGLGIPPENLNRQGISSQRVGRLLSGDLELPHDKPPRDERGARYRLEPERLQQLVERFGLTPSLQTSATSERQPEAQSSAKNGLFDGASGVPDVPDDPDVCSKGDSGCTLHGHRQDSPFPTDREPGQPPPKPGADDWGEL